jgi:nucleotide-binding universal stress UspA family protein
MSVIVVATDGSAAATAALDEAIEIARCTGDQLAAITVWRALQGDFGLAYPSTAMLDELLDAERNHAEVTLSEAVARARAAGVVIETRLATGDPAEQICNFADELDARMISMGTHGYSAVVSLLVGSVSGAVLRRAPCPVLIVGEGNHHRKRSDRPPTTRHATI